jgi:hypothetical protein
VEADSTTSPHADSVSKLPAHGQVVRYHQHAGAELALYVLQERHDLGLHHDVERRDGLVEDEVHRAEEQCTGQNDPLQPEHEVADRPRPVHRGNRILEHRLDRTAVASELRARQRRYENQAADHQGRLWMRDAGLTVMPAYPFGCECGESGCRATWTATPADYAARTASERRLIAHAQVRFAGGSGVDGEVEVG